MGGSRRSVRRHGKGFRVADFRATCVALAFAAMLVPSLLPVDGQIDVRVGVYHNPPKVAIDSDGRVSGLYPELVESIAAAEGWEIEYIRGSWTESLERLDRGEIDLMVDVAYTVPRQALYAFNEETVLVNWGTVYVRAGLKLLSLPDLEGLRIAVMRGSTHTDDPGGIRDLVQRFGIRCTFIDLDDYTEVFQALASGDADAGVVNRVFGLTFEAEYGVERTPIVFNPIELRFALPPDGPLTSLLIDRIDYRLAELKADPESVYYRTLEENLLEGPGTETVFRWPAWVLPGMSSAGALIAILAVATLLIRREARHRAKAEEAYRRSEERFALAMRGANDGLWDWNLTTGEVYYSPRWMAMLGYNEIAPTIEAFRRLLHPEDRDRVLAVEASYLEGQVDRYQVEFRIRHRSGTYVDILSRGFLVRDDEGRPLRVVGTHVDISEQKLAAQQLKEAKERAEAADRIKSAFLATMSHELRTPLNSIIGFTGILLQKLPGPLTEEQAKQLGMVQTSARHLLDLINDVLDISKIEAGQLEVVFEPFDLRDMLANAVGAARPLAESKGLELRVDIAESVSEITSDRRRLSQILTNLLSNAIKFTESGYVHVRCTDDGESIVLSVEDTGIGIGEPDLAELFTPFRQVDSGLTRKYEGTGLGLSICKRLAEKLGGRIDVVSRPGQGTTFSVRIPKGDQA